MSGEAEWRWADPRGQQRLVRLDELRAALSNGVIPPNAPIWKRGWPDWIPASDVPELMSQALAAANGIVPNIPPPPLFVVAAQSEFESHTPDAKGDDTPYAEPPPPPPYVPVPTPSSQPNLPPPSPPVPAAHGSPAPAGVSPSVNRLKTAKKQTMLGMPPAANPPPAAASPAPPPAKPASMPPAISASPATGSSGAEQLKKALPQDAPASSRFGVEPGPKQQNLPTVVGVPAIADPRTQIDSKKSDRPVPPTPPPAPEGAPLKRPTLILYGGAPQEDAERASSAPPIVATAPGAPAGKNAVTQAPPWDAGAVELGPDIPKDARTPRLPSDSSDEISASFFIESTEAGPKIASPPKRASSIPPPLRPKSMPPPLRGSLPPEKGRTKRPPPFVPNHTPSFTIGDVPTTDLGAPPPPFTAVPPLDSDAAATNQLPAALSGDADTTNKYEPHEQPQPPPGGSFLVHLDPLIARFPKLAPTRDQLAKFEEGKPRFLLPVIAGLVALVGVLIFAMFLKLIFGGHDDATTVAKPNPPASANPVASNAPTPTATTPATATAAPKPTAVAAIATSPCTLIGSPKTIAPKALVPTGVEVVAAGNAILVGFASGPKEGAAIALNPSTLGISSTVKTKAGDLLKRVEPLPIEGRAQVSPNTDKKGDLLTGRRTVPSSPSYDLGVADGNLAWAPRASDKISSLWSLSGSGAVEALRGVPLDGGGGVAIAYRRAGAIWLGVATGDKSLSPGNLTSVQGLGPQVGSPAIAASGNTVLAIWADRASASDAWGLRMQRWKIGETPSAAEEFSPPAGGLGAPFMSPGVASLGGGRFLIVWTEGAAQGHQVRALTLGPDGQPQGQALTVSADGENAGQGQAAVNGEGKGVVAYLVSAGAKNFQVTATAITCPK